MQAAREYLLSVSALPTQIIYSETQLFVFRETL